MEKFRLLSQFLVSGSTPKQLEDFLTLCKIDYTSKNFKQSIHFRSYSEGFQVEYQKSQNSDTYAVNSVFIYINNPKSKPYRSQNSLPYLLSHKMTIKSAVYLLGEPTSKSKYTTQCSWAHLGIDINFAGLSWTDQQLKMDYLVLYTPDQSRGSICSVCLKDIGGSKMGCRQCEASVQYCSENCKQKHYRLHKIICQQVDS